MNAYYRSSQLLQRLNKCLAGFRPCGEVVSIESDGIVGDKRVIVNKIELARLTFARGDHLVEDLLCLANLLPCLESGFCARVEEDGVLNDFAMLLGDDQSIFLAFGCALNSYRRIFD